MLSRSKWLWVLIGVVLAILVIFISVLDGRKPKPANQPAGAYLDPLSHQTVSNPPGKALDIYGSTPGAPIYLGSDALLDHGLTFDQLTNLKAAFYAYSKSHSNSVREISIDVDHIENSHDPHASTSPFTLKFNVRFNRLVTYQAQVTYSGLETIKLTLTDPTSRKTVFTSSIIGSN